VQALLLGDMKDEEPWQQTLPWIRDLTRRAIGQLWIHHTGHDTGRSYGTKTREWQLDMVMLAETAERADTDIAFGLSFTKARERSPENREDYQPVTVTLANDQWNVDGAAATLKASRLSAAQSTALRLLAKAVNEAGEVPPASNHIPAGVRCVPEDLWRRYCYQGAISSGNQDAKQKAFKRAAEALVAAGRAGKWEPWCWPA
jgi:hypothetical protein